MNNFLLELLSGTLASIGESKLVEALQLLHDKNRVAYEAAIKGGHAFAVAMEAITDSSKTKIDDAIVASIKEAIETSAAANGVEL